MSPFSNGHRAALIATLAACFIGWLAWYLASYFQAERAAVQAAAAQALGCPGKAIARGPSRQFNDGQKEIPVTGCGRSATILCDDESAARGMLGQYFHVDLRCYAQQ